MKRILALALCIPLCATVYAQPKLNRNNIPAVVKAMTPEEKINLVVGWNDACDNYVRQLPEAGGSTYPFEKYGIPSLLLVDGPMGVRIGTDWPGSDGKHYATCFPDGLNLAASWSTATLEAVGRAIGEETRDFGADVILGPGMNLLRNPLNGRNFEYFSEDPALTGYIAAAYVNGVQSTGVATSAKHYAANSQETNRLDGDSRMDTRTLRELYTRAFEIVVRESRPKTIMASYNKLNGVYTQESRGLLTDILRKEFGFKGLIMTDWTGLRNTPVQLDAGCDLLMGGSPKQTAHLLRLKEEGSLDMADLDRAVTKILELVVDSPVFNGYKPSFKPDLKAHAAVVRDAAADGFVLLKNDRETLPIRSKDASVALFGVRSYDLIPGGNGAALVHNEHTSQIYEALEAEGFKLDADLTRLYRLYAEYAAFDLVANHVEKVHVGKALTPELDIDRSVIKAAAKKHDLAIITLGRTSGEARDRILDIDFKIQPAEKALLENVCREFHSAGKRVVVLLNICGPVETSSWKELPDAILNIWLPGGEGGAAAVDVLTGKTNPSGRLPMTFPVDYFDAPGASDFPYDFRSGKANESAVHPERRGLDPKNLSFTEYTEGIWAGYRHFSTHGAPVSYPFGFGLSYTDFETSDASVKLVKDRITASVKVVNTGRVAGKHSVGMYVSAPSGGMNKPAYELKAFAKTRVLQPGESEVLNFSFPVRDLSSFNPQKSRWELAKGDYTARFGGAADGIFKDAAFVIKKAKNYPAARVCEPR